MTWIDSLIVALPLVTVLAVTAYARRYLKSVADFMAGGRLGGRYLLATARSEMGAGAIGYVAMFEWFSHGGFSVGWWQNVAGPIGLIITITGYVGYRYRQTRALTLAQFFEMRYSRSFRFFTGILASIAGLLNFGVIPVVGGKFMVHFLDLPQQVVIFSCQVPTYLILMGVFLSLTTYITLAGGQITVMMADCIQGMFSQVFYVIISVALIVTLNWHEARAMLLDKPPGQSFVNPFDSFSVKDFNIWYVLMGIWGGLYTSIGWQNASGFNAAAASAHEARMGNILGSWRGFAQRTVMILLALSALTFLHQPTGQALVQHRLDQIADPQTAEQMRVPIGLAAVLPIGIKGLFVSLVLMGILGGDGQALHSWGTIFFQDVILPLRKKPFSVRTHIILLRLSIIGVAVFAFLFGALFTQTEYLPMWFQITVTIFVGGAGACITGGLYWSRATTEGAWAGLITGSLLAIGGILVRQPSSVDWFHSLCAGLGWTSNPTALYIADHLGRQFPLNGTVISFYASLIAVAVFALVSLATGREPHNMDRLLHRGKYAIEPEAAGEPIHPRPARSRFHPYSIVGIDEHFTRHDRWVALGILIWSLFWFVVFLVGTAWNLIHPWSADTWVSYSLYTGIHLGLVVSVLTTIWFTIGCWNDLVLFFRRLASQRVDKQDDGTVEHGGKARHP